MIFEQYYDSYAKSFCVMIWNMSRFIIFAICIFTSVSVFADEIKLLHANEWSIPKQASTILAMPAINSSMLKLQKNMSSTLKLKYPGGDEGTLWANELRSWLIALGLSSKRIELVPGSAISTTIELEVISN